ncbi:MAG: flagellar hook-length control protein FliK [Firmicutes bacterium]|nr:flagellar hook-length control protein FliK [Bacillota bacterium]
MNIVETPFLGVSLNPTGQSQPGKSPKVTGGFEPLLGEFAAQLNGSDEAIALNSDPQIRKGLLLLIAGGDKPQDSYDMEDLIARLGERLINLIIEALKSGNTDIKKEDIVPILDELLSGLAVGEGDTNTRNMFIKLLGNFSLSSGEGGKGGLGRLTDGLPDSLKLKLRLFAHRTGQSLSDQELDMVKYKLVANLLSLMGLEAGKTDGALAGGIDTKLAIHLRDMFMERFHVRQNAANQVAGQSAVGGTVSAADGGQVSATSQVTAEAQVSGVTGMNELLQAAAADDGSDVPVALVQSLPAADAAAQQTGIAQGESTDVALDTAKLPVADKGLASQSGAGVQQITADAKSTDTSANDAATSNTGSSGSQSNYSYTVENKQPFATELTQKDSSTAMSGAAADSVLAADPKQLIERLVEKLDVLVSGARSEARIQLKPRYLGELKIHLTIEGGTIRAVLDASTHQAKQIIEENLGNLKQSLEEQGLKIKEFHVSVGQNNEGHSRDTDHQHRERAVSNYDRAAIVQEIQKIRTRLSLGLDMAVNYLA